MGRFTPHLMSPFGRLFEVIHIVRLHSHFFSSEVFIYFFISYLALVRARTSHSSSTVAYAPVRINIVSASSLTLQMQMRLHCQSLHLRRPSSVPGNMFEVIPKYFKSTHIHTSHLITFIHSYSHLLLMSLTFIRADYSCSLHPTSMRAYYYSMSTKSTS